MDSNCQNFDLNSKYLLAQLNTARKEINNLRQQIKSLRYIHEKDIDDIKRLLESYTRGVPASEAKVVSSVAVKPSTSSADEVLKLKPIGIISTWFPTKRGTPRQPGICGKAPGKLVLYNSVFTNPDHALEGLQDFSHMWILFYFHRNDSTHIRAKVAPPRLNGTRTGVFSTRSPHRPCPIGLSLVKITKIECCTIYFEGVDMVDQTPVIDIKPYIPLYDSPVYFEKLSNRSQECITNNAETFSRIEETAVLRTEQIYNTHETCVERGNGFRSVQSEYYNRKGFCKTTQDTDISRDEEIALRLQTEEFQGNSNLDGYDESSARQPPESIDVIPQQSNSSLHDDIDVTITHGPVHTLQSVTSDVRRAFDASTAQSSTLPGSNVDLPSESLAIVSGRLQNINVTGRISNEPLGYALRNRERDYVVDAYVSRNSRLLDGADGPNTVCGTDLDFVHRRSLNVRADNSPVRMGVREAPDGEEGLESQTLLTPSQTLPNIHVARTTATTTTANSNASDIANTNTGSSVELRAESAGDVRVPEWISRPQTPLSVLFNDRALIQLNEILGTKINDQKGAIENVLREDPRSVYLRQRWGSQFYTFLIHDLHITCRFDDNRGVVTVFQVRHAGRICECGEPEWQCLGHSPIS